MSWERLKDKNLQKRLAQRAKIISLAREFFVAKGFLEVQTPILVKFAGQEPYLDPMKVENFGYLITSPEYSHKKLLAQGFEKIFEITKCFRNNEPVGGLHNPEFTMLEWYRTRATYYHIMQDVESLIQYVWCGLQSKSREKSQIPNPKSQINSKFQNSKIVYQGHKIDLSAPWERITVREAFRKYANVRLESVRNDDDFFKIFLTHIEPKLGFTKPTILYEYPARMASLARMKPSPQPSPKRRGGVEIYPSPSGRGEGEGQWAERFELYIAGMELANAFSELNNEQEQRRRFLQEQKLRKKLGKEIIPLDEDFLNAVGNMPPSAGIALGIDRLVMLLTNAKTIEQVLAFPAKEDIA